MSRSIAIGSASGRATLVTTLLRRRVVSNYLHTACASSHRIVTARPLFVSSAAETRNITSRFYSATAATTNNYSNNDITISKLRNQYYATAATKPNDDEGNRGINNSNHNYNNQNNGVRLSKLLSQYATNVIPPISRNEAERLIRSGNVKIAGQVILEPQRILVQDEYQNGALTLRDKALHFIIKPVQQQDDDVTTKSTLYQLSPKQDVAKTTAAAATQNNSPLEQPKDELPRVWIVHKLAGELVTENDPHDRPSIFDRLKRSGFGRMSGSNKTSSSSAAAHIKSVGRLDANTEGLLLLTSCGQYSRQMELPANAIHRTYRVRVHGFLNDNKIKRIERGNITNEKDGIRYSPMKIHVDNSSSGKNTILGMTKSKRRQRSNSTGGTNQWLHVTCCEGKNRQIRNAFQNLGLTVTRLIRISFGDYQLQTIPPGMVVEVPYKPISNQRRKGPLFSKQEQRGKLPGRQKSSKSMKPKLPDEELPSPVQWVRSYR